MKTRSVLKKIAAFVGATALVGSTVAGALAAADIASLPEPFVHDGTFDAYIVVGQNAATIDVAGAIELAAAFAAKAVTPTGGTVTLTSEEDASTYTTVDFYKTGPSSDWEEINGSVVPAFNKYYWTKDDNEYNATQDFTVIAGKLNSTGYKLYINDGAFELTLDEEGDDTKICENYTVKLLDKVYKVLDVERDGSDHVKNLTLGTIEEVTLEEGEEYTAGDVAIKVASIDTTGTVVVQWIQDGEPQYEEWLSADDSATHLGVTVEVKSVLASLKKAKLEVTTEAIELKNNYNFTLDENFKVTVVDGTAGDYCADQVNIVSQKEWVLDEGEKISLFGGLFEFGNIEIADQGSKYNMTLWEKNGLTVAYINATDAASTSVGAAVYFTPGFFPGMKYVLKKADGTIVKEGFQEDSDGTTYSVCGTDDFTLHKGTAISLNATNLGDGTSCSFIVEVREPGENEKLWVNYTISDDSDSSDDPDTISITEAYYIKGTDQYALPQVTTLGTYFSAPQNSNKDLTLNNTLTTVTIGSNTYYLRYNVSGVYSGGEDISGDTLLVGDGTHYIAGKMYYDGETFKYVEENGHEIKVKFGGNATGMWIVHGESDISGETDYGTKIYNNITTDKDPWEYLNETVTLEIPFKQIKAGVENKIQENHTVSVGEEVNVTGIVKVTSVGGVTTGGVATGVSKLDTEIDTEALEKPVILVGGPAVNTLVAELADAGKTMTVEEWREEENGTRVWENRAIIDLIEDAFNGKAALVVAGYSGEDTLKAARLLAGYVLGENELFASVNETRAVIDTENEALVE